MTGPRRALAHLAAWNAAAFVALALYGFASTRLVVRTSGEDGYGVWATVGAIRGFILFLDAGLAFGVSRDAALLATDDGAALRIRATRRIHAGLAAAALAFFAVASQFPSQLLGLTGGAAQAARGATLLLGAEAAVVLVASPLAAVLRGRQRFDVIAVAAWSQALVCVGLLLVLAP